MFSLKNFGNWIVDAVVGAKGGKYVTPDTALSYPPIWYAVNKIAGHVGQLPLVLHRKTTDGRGREIADWHPAYRLLKTAPNSWQTPVVFKELLQTHALLWGNAYAYIKFDGGIPVELWPLYPGRTAPELVKGKKSYLHLPADDEPINEIANGTEGVMRRDGYIVIEDYAVMHIPGLGFDGYAGKSLWKVASDSWQIGLESDNRIKNGFKHGFKAAILLEAPPEAFRKGEDVQKFINDFNEYHSGSENADKAGLLTRGIKANVIQMNSSEAQMVEHRRYQRQDAALWFLLEQILGDDSSVSYNSLEQKNLAYLSNCLMRWLVKWEEESNRKLIRTNSQRYYFKFNTAALLRADHKTTMETLTMGITARIYSPNDAREKLDENPYEGGDSYENPAVTPGATGAGSQQDNSQSDNQPQNLALRAKMAHMIRIESGRVTAMCGRNNFCDALDKFYEGWQVTLTSALAELGGDVDLAAVYCKKSKELLLECAGMTPEEDKLSAIVTDCVRSWDRRVEELCELKMVAA